MPELKIKDIRLPELRLPEMSRDDIAKALGEARKEITEVRKELNDFRRDFEAPKVEAPSIEMPSIEDAKAMITDARKAAKQARKNAREAGRKVGKDVTRAAQDAGIVERPSRVPFVLAGIVTLGLVAWALMNSPRLRERLQSAAETARTKVNERRDTDHDRPVAYDAASRAGVEPSPFDDAIPATDSPFSEPPSDLPAGLGKTKGIGKTNGSNTIVSDEATPA
jgi:hypothetical protein